MGILQFIHADYTNIKKFLWFHNSKLQIFKKIKILLLVLFLIIGAFITMMNNTSEIFANEKQRKELLTDIQDKQEIPEDTSEPEDDNQENEEPEQSEYIDQKNEPPVNANIKGKWKIKNSKVFYYENGKKIKGIKKIGTKYYYFDLKGVQHTGWQRYKKNYYFFKISNGKKGYMTKSKKVNEVLLDKNGKAKLTVKNKAKLEVLVQANKIVEKITKPSMEKSKKLKKTFKYLIKYYQYHGSPTFILYYSPNESVTVQSHIVP